MVNNRPDVQILTVVCIFVPRLSSSIIFVNCASIDHVRILVAYWIIKNSFKFCFASNGV